MGCFKDPLRTKIVCSKDKKKYYKDFKINSKIFNEIYGELVIKQKKFIQTVNMGMGFLFLFLKSP